MLGFTGGQGVVLGRPLRSMTLLVGPRQCRLGGPGRPEPGGVRRDRRRVRQRIPESVIANDLRLHGKAATARSSSWRRFGRHSSSWAGPQQRPINKRLAEWSPGRGGPTSHREGRGALRLASRLPADRVSAGASTPTWIIDRVSSSCTARFGESGRNSSATSARPGSSRSHRTYSGPGGPGASPWRPGSLGPDRAPPPNAVRIALCPGLAHHHRFINRRNSGISSWQAGSYLTPRKDFYNVAWWLLLSLGAAPACGQPPSALLSYLSGLLFNDSFSTGLAVQAVGDSPGQRERRHRHRLGCGGSPAPRVEAGFVPTFGLAVALALNGGILFVRSALSDILDVQSDRLFVGGPCPSDRARANPHSYSGSGFWPPLVSWRWF